MKTKKEDLSDNERRGPAYLVGGKGGGTLQEVKHREGEDGP